MPEIVARTWMTRMPCAAAARSLSRAAISARPERLAIMFPASHTPAASRTSAMKKFQRSALMPSGGVGKSR